MKVEVMKFFRGADSLNVEDSVFEAGIVDGDQVEVEIKLKVPKLHFWVICIE
jgi:hypothetical protein